MLSGLETKNVPKIHKSLGIFSQGKPPVLSTPLGKHPAVWLWADFGTWEQYHWGQLDLSAQRAGYVCTSLQKHHEVLLSSECSLGPFTGGKKIICVKLPVIRETSSCLFSGSQIVVAMAKVGFKMWRGSTFVTSADLKGLLFPYKSGIPFRLPRRHQQASSHKRGFHHKMVICWNQVYRLQQTGQCWDWD